MKVVSRVLLTAVLISVGWGATGCSLQEPTEPMEGGRSMDLSGYSALRPDRKLNLLFIHHSVGGDWLAEPGSARGDNSIHQSSPRGGGLRALLEANNYVVHEASYGSRIGENTDICHWRRKFRDQMEEILRCEHQDEMLPEGEKNEIVMFKSCYPNNWIAADGQPPGDSDDCDRTLANSEAAYRALLEIFRERPDTLFVAVTAPPLTRPVKPRWMERAKEILGRPDTVERVGRRARVFNNWLKDEKAGWLKDYAGKNVVVFDLFDILTDYGPGDWSAYPTLAGKDSHPTRAGNEKATQAFVLFLNRAVHRMGL
jgi:hypothetical protein